MLNSIPIIHSILIIHPIQSNQFHSFHTMGNIFRSNNTEQTTNHVNAAPQRPPTVKIPFLGFYRVGKTSLARRLQGVEYDQMSSIGKLKNWVNGSLGKPWRWTETKVNNRSRVFLLQHPRYSLSNLGFWRSWEISGSQSNVLERRLCDHLCGGFNKCHSTRQTTIAWLVCRRDFSSSSISHFRQ